jgi:CheY-like chemotaxis protein
MEYKFLIVDDDADDHEFVTAAIKNVHPGAHVKSFFDGVELSTHWFSDSERPHIILLDLNMRIVDGKTALKYIRSDKDLKNIPVVVLTTDKGHYSKPHYLELGANDFYSKPYELPEMVKIINRITDDWIRKTASA